jgi:hypothetical protein
MVVVEREHRRGLRKAAITHVRHGRSSEVPLQVPMAEAAVGRTSRSPDDAEYPGND